MNNHLIILAAGHGSRCGLGYNKILHKINDQTVLSLLLNNIKSTFEKFKSIIIVCNSDDILEIKNIISHFNFPFSIVFGGNSRHESFLKAINSQNFLSDDKIIIHDACRCAITSNDLLEFINCDSAIATAGKISNDSIYDCKNNRVLCRDNLLLLATPQMVNWSVLSKCNLSDNDNYYDLLDFLGHYLKIENRIKVIKANDNFMKITYSDDLEKIKRFFKI